MRAMSSTTEMASVQAVASAVGTLAVLAAEVVLLVVVLTSVRRNKPRAVGGLIAAAIIMIASTVLSLVAYPLLGFALASRGDVETTMLGYAAMGIGFSLLHTLAIVLLAVGLMRVAAPETSESAFGR